MSFLKAYRKEMDCWDWSRMPGVSKAIIIAFVFCLHLRLQGTSFEKMMGASKIQSDYEI